MKATIGAIASAWLVILGSLSSLFAQARVRAAIRSDGWPPSTITLLGDDSHSCAEERATTLWALA